jgi:Uma2 family endonuclease
MALSKPAGTWTYDDLFSLPDDGRRYEIIEGELYEMPSPNFWHATTIMNLIALLLPVVGALHGRLYTASLDVFFPGADPVVPDILAILPSSRAVGRQRGVEGPPDLIIEVLSPANRDHDLVTKRVLYARAGVREYWIVDPRRRTVDVLTLDRGAFHAVPDARSGPEIVSPLLGNATFQVERIFAGLDEIVD